jgi:hypothetical protein
MVEKTIRWQIASPTRLLVVSMRTAVMANWSPFREDWFGWKGRFVGVKEFDQLWNFHYCSTSFLLLSVSCERKPENFQKVWTKNNRNPCVWNFKLSNVKKYDISTSCEICKSFQMTDFAQRLLVSKQVSRESTLSIIFILILSFFDIVLMSCSSHIS